LLLQNLKHGYFQICQSPRPHSKSWVYGRSLVAIEGSNPASGMGVSSVNVAFSKVEVSAWGLSLVRRSPGECCVSERDRTASKTKRLWPAMGCDQWLGGGVKVKISHYRFGVANRLGRAIALLFHDRCTRGGWVVSWKPRPHFTPWKDPVPILQEPEGED